MSGRRVLTRALVVLFAVISLVVATGCSSDDAKSGSLAISDQWVKAAESDMTAAFAKLTNDGDADIRIVSASSPIAATTELHEIVPDGDTTVMRQKDGGYLIPAHSTLDLKPGGDHIMLMGLKAPIKAGDKVEISLRTDDGETHEVEAIARDFSGNKEDYHH